MTGIKSGNIPAVSYVKPSGLVDGHPASSKLILFEGFVKKIVDAVNANPTLKDNTAIFVTEDEGGGYWDSGYVQPLDFFGDGTRIPLIVVSKYSKGGHISHDYADHVSISKFIERNWGLRPITNRSRDNLPNPIYEDNAYVPVNSPALGDLWDLFDFRQGLSRRERNVGPRKRADTLGRNGDFRARRTRRALSHGQRPPAPPSLSRPRVESGQRPKGESHVLLASSSGCSRSPELRDRRHGACRRPCQLCDHAEGS